MIVLSGCTEISGPVAWKPQELRLEKQEPKEEGRGSTYVLIDRVAGFRAVGGVPGYRRDYDLLAHRSLAFPKGEKK